MKWLHTSAVRTFLSPLGLASNKLTRVFHRLAAEARLALQDNERIIIITSAYS